MAISSCCYRFNEVREDRAVIKCGLYKLVLVATDSTLEAYRKQLYSFFFWATLSVFFILHPALWQRKLTCCQKKTLKDMGRRTPRKTHQSLFFGNIWGSRLSSLSLIMVWKPVFVHCRKAKLYLGLLSSVPAWALQEHCTISRQIGAYSEELVSYVSTEEAMFFSHHLPGWITQPSVQIST